MHPACLDDIVPEPVDQRQGLIPLEERLMLAAKSDQNDQPMVQFFERKAEKLICLAKKKAGAVKPPRFALLHKGNEDNALPLGQLDLLPN